MSNDSQNLRGLNGWLILIGIGVIFGPLRLVFFLATTFYPIFADGTWELLTDPASEYFTEYIALLLVFELLVNFLLLTASICLVFLFFKKRRNFPKLYIAIAVFSVVFIVIDAWVTSLVFPETSVFDAATIQELARVAPSVLIWTPYMLVSKRVRATFIEPFTENGKVIENDA